MTRRDYIAIAGAIAKVRLGWPSDVNAAIVLNTTAKALATVIARDNAAFDVSRFLDACGV